MDSSVLVKRHIAEVGSEWVHALFRETPQPTVLTSLLSFVEVYSAFNRRRREDDIDFTAYQELSNDFQRAYKRDYQIVQINHEIVVLARELLERHPLRAYDAIQLGSAIQAGRIITRPEFSPLAFLAADLRLLDAASAEGIQAYAPGETI
jgi:uncharacterized protein